MLIGHEEAWTAWRAALTGARMHHAWLLTGKAGLGKGHFALAAAHELVGGGPPPQSHPDIMTLSYGPKDDQAEAKRAEGKPYELARGIRIKQIRDLQRRLTTRPTLGDRRAVIIDPADAMEGGAANALLKSLEEPPQGTVFLLVNHNPARLLPTIRSRCRLLRFAPLPDDTLSRLLATRAGDTAVAERAAALVAAAGSPGAALAYAGMGLAPLAKAMRHIRDSGDAEFAARGELATLIGARPDRDRMRAVLDLARAIAGEGVESLPAHFVHARIAAHAGLVRLSAEQATYNYDPGLFALELGNLLASCAAASSEADA